MNMQYFADDCRLWNSAPNNGHYDRSPFGGFMWSEKLATMARSVRVICELKERLGGYSNAAQGLGHLSEAREESRIQATPRQCVAGDLKADHCMQYSELQHLPA